MGFNRVLCDLNLDSDFSFLNSSNVCVYAFDLFDDFLEFCDLFRSFYECSLDDFSSSSLFLFDGVFYLVLNNVSSNLAFLEGFCALISEYASFVSSSYYFVLKLVEFGDVVFLDNAILCC